MDLYTPINEIDKIGKYYSTRLKKLNIQTVHDLLFHIPSRYEDLSQIKHVNEVAPDETDTISGQIWEIRNVRTKYGKNLTFATIHDGTGTIDSVWFNQPFLTKTFKVGLTINLSGKIGHFNNKLTLINPEYEIRYKKERPIHTGRLVPIYPETAGITSKWLRSRTSNLLNILSPKLNEYLPNPIIKRNKLLDLKTALYNIHFPDKLEDSIKARERLAFDELLLIQLSTIKRKLEWQENLSSTPLKIDQEKILHLISTLPFQLTAAQNQSIKDILTDLAKNTPMNRLLQGDVGSGKTVVATVAIYAAYLNKLQSTLMAPTEILSIQHFQTISSILNRLGVKVGLRTGSTKEKGDFDCIIGTHALLSEGFKFPNLGLIIIDEQHRFGVIQRATLRSKSQSPHVLTMTATPIPRSLALTLYGNLDLSSLDELPEGRLKIKTFVVPPNKRNSAYTFIEGHIKSGNQAFIICPLIDPSESLESVKSAKEEHQRLQNEVFPELNLGLLHGRLPSKEKQNVIEKFRRGDYHILVSTPVVEVGIDITNTNVMMIEAAERFGLAALHQLRGRVGRGLVQSYCLLFTESTSKEVIERLKLLEKYNIGLKLAEMDLTLRGPGELYGTAQHGVPSLKAASFQDLKLIQQSRKEALAILEKDKSLKSFPILMEKLERFEEDISPD